MVEAHWVLHTDINTDSLQISQHYIANLYCSYHGYSYYSIHITPSTYAYIAKANSYLTLV